MCECFFVPFIHFSFLLHLVSSHTAGATRYLIYVCMHTFSHAYEWHRPLTGGGPSSHNTRTRIHAHTHARSSAHTHMQTEHTREVKKKPFHPHLSSFVLAKTSRQGCHFNLKKVCIRVFGACVTCSHSVSIILLENRSVTSATPSDYCFQVIFVQKVMHFASNSARKCYR